MTPKFDTLLDIHAERHRQEEKWGQQDHSPERWYTILGEEVGEVGKAINEAYDNYRLKGKPGKQAWKDYRDELVQVAAVAVAAIESLDRNGG